jgi:hypothetical protein
LQAAFLIPEGAIILFTNDYSAPYQKHRENTPAPGAVEKAPPGRLFHPGREQSNKLINRQNLNINF